MKILSLLSILMSFFLFSHISYAEQMANTAKSQQTQLVANKEKQIPQLNINKASAEEIAKSLKGIGINKAKKIIEYREKLGPFVSIEQLKEVSGIGQLTLDKNKGKIAL